MRFCSRCGKQINEEAAICIYCGCAVEGSYGSRGEERSGLSTCAVVFSILVPIVGFVLGIIGACIYRDKGLKAKCVTAIILSICIPIIIYVIVFVVVYLFTLYTSAIYY